jgi:hypothetical protein
LTRLAAYIDSRAQIASVHRRLERFFRDVWLNQADIARLVVAALSLTAQPWHLREFVIRLTRLSGFAAFAGSRSLFINKLDGKVFTTEADPVSVGAVIPIAPLHRYASLICFLQEAYQDTKDHIFDMYRKRCSATLDFWR